MYFVKSKKIFFLIYQISFLEPSNLSHGGNFPPVGNHGIIMGAASNTAAKKIKWMLVITLT